MNPAAEERERLDRRAIARFLEGEQEAFTELVERHQEAVRAFARAFACAAEDADDLAQEIFVQAHRSLRGFRGDAAFGTWLYSVARNVCRRRLRARRTLQRRVPETQDPDWLEIPDPRPGQEAALERQEARALVAEALKSLPPGHRAALALSHWEGLPYAEIARLLDIPEGTVKSRVHNAIVMLAERLRSLPEAKEA